MSFVTIAQEGIWGGVDMTSTNVRRLITARVQPGYVTCQTQGRLPGCLFRFDDPDAQCREGRKGVCVHACVCVCVCVCVHACMHVCVCVCYHLCCFNGQVLCVEHVWKIMVWPLTSWIALQPLVTLDLHCSSFSVSVQIHVWETLRLAGGFLMDRWLCEAVIVTVW